MKTRKQRKSFKGGMNTTFTHKNYVNFHKRLKELTGHNYYYNKSLPNTTASYFKPNNKGFVPNNRKTKKVRFNNNKPNK
jgi:hypothetical protein